MKVAIMKGRQGLGIRAHARGRSALLAPVAALVALACGLASGDGRAASKDECLDAHSRGQDLRDAGRLTSARQTFLACAQSSCPALIQADCARFSEELDRLVPTVGFGARDQGGVDLPDTSVYVDDQLMTMRLDDGKSYDLDPGKHAVRFVHEGHETAITVVLNQGEKGRSVVATFADPAEAARSTPSLPPAAAQGRRPAGPLVVAGLGAAAMVTGAVLVVVGLKEVPSDCAVGSGQCTAPPGDPSIEQARRGVSLANVGLGVGIGGTSLLVGGALWYFLQPVRPRTESGAAFAPWLGDRSGGMNMSARF
jgi:hypothetical protein